MAENKRKMSYKVTALQLMTEKRDRNLLLHVVLSDNVPCIAEYLHQLNLLFCNLNTQSNTLAGDLLLPLLRVVCYPIYR